MEPVELLAIVGGTMDRLRIPRFTTGSVASTIYGEPRFTNDIDMVVRLGEREARELCGSFAGPAWYVSEEAAAIAARERGQFNIIHTASGLKVDVMVADDSEFDRGRFERAHQVRMADGRIEPFASPEDVILKKLQYFREGASDKHLRDIASILVVQGDALDWAYLRRWADRLGVVEQLRLVAPDD